MRLNIWLKIIIACFVFPGNISASDKTIHKFVDKTVAGIDIGKYSEDKLLNLYGIGTSLEEGYAVCYYNNKEKSVLVVEYGPDKLIEGVIVVQEAHAKYFDKCKKKVIAFISRTKKGVGLGDSPEKVIDIYGEPENKEIKEGILIFEYHTDNKKDSQVTLFYDAYLYFKNEKLVKLAIHDGE